MMFKEKITDMISRAAKLPKAEAERLIEVPPDHSLGDYAFPCFVLAGKLKKAPAIIADELAGKIRKASFIAKIEAKGPYLNFFIEHREIAKNVLSRISKEKQNFGKRKKSKKTIIVEFSSPNIAKPFGIGHLRSTVIGNCLGKIFAALGYNVVGVNHLGDWGTQFGKLITAYRKWGNEKKLENDPIKHLLSLYVKFHKEAEKNKKLDDEARAWFKKLEDGDKEALTLWENFRELSLEEFRKIYSILSIEFDSMHGESFYNSKMREVLRIAEKKKVAKKSEGAVVIEINDKLPPLILVKSDGASTYATRDIAAAIYRLKEYKPVKLVYVVGSEQKMHFEQVFTALGRLGYSAEKFVHVDFGLFRFPEGKMSTRKGRVIFLEDVLDKAIALAEKIIKKKNPGLKNKKEVAREVGIGAIIFADLSNDRVHNIEFDWGRMLSFEGETGPYLQYTHARACSILRKALNEYKTGVSPKVQFERFSLEEEKAIIRQLASYPEILARSAESYKPHHLAHCLLSLAQAFNEFYHKCPVISEEKAIMKARLLLVDCVRQVLENGLNLLGIKAPGEM